MTYSHFFGYGSLVNRATHDHTDHARASVTGWRRAWRTAPGRVVSFLTVIPDESAVIRGLIAAVSTPEDWQALDRREHAYEKCNVTERTDHRASHISDICIYAVPEPALMQPDDTHPVLMSYLDAVLQGYLREFGPEGVAHFFNTTTGWTAPFLDDRAAPRYPRARRLSDAERDLVDSWMQQFDCRIVEDDGTQAAPHALP